MTTLSMRSALNMIMNHRAEELRKSPLWHTGSRTLSANHAKTQSFVTQTLLVCVQQPCVTAFRLSALSEPCFLSLETTQKGGLPLVSAVPGLIPALIICSCAIPE
jgi:hypothetical protein